MLSGSQEAYARQTLAAVVKSIAGDRHDDINGYARAAVSAIKRDPVAQDVVSLVGILERKPFTQIDPFGTLVFRVQLEADNEGWASRKAFDGCYKIDFNQYGATDKRVWKGTNYLHQQPCLAEAKPVAPPIDKSIKYVVAANAEEAATSVLSEMTSDAGLDSDAIAAKILALLDVPGGEYEVLAPPTVIVADGNVGVAMGYKPHDCVLVARVDDVVSRIRPPSILLEPGELGCRPETALMDAAELAPPH